MFLDVNLACVFELHLQLNEEGSSESAGFLYPLRDFGLYPGSMPVSSVSIYISHQLLLEVSLLYSQTLQCGPEHILFSL